MAPPSATTRRCRGTPSHPYMYCNAPKAVTLGALQVPTQPPERGAQECKAQKNRLLR
eukprot:CAMPEP_0182863138 /NCGR_PEP_ID=MMETSP0034_2-20130328/6474_1 /TAXON_ID=156128 /ORGANISM="Nephroselmis pyriformis, Strain CCMP717" /LENGTH=56 /DNA_ID=CAMNT_0024995309 /DNA_START=106 /DNA_END=272 /DNA_ORIENTATION=-